jgi:hypothetical protein
MLLHSKAIRILCHERVRSAANSIETEAKENSLGTTSDTVRIASCGATQLCATCSVDKRPKNTLIVAMVCYDALLSVAPQTCAWKRGTRITGISFLIN